jgi:hypothetical protein
VLAPLPNAVFSRCGSDDFTDYDGNNAAVDIGRFLTGVSKAHQHQLILIQAWGIASLQPEPSSQPLRYRLCWHMQR